MDRARRLTVADARVVERKNAGRALDDCGTKALGFEGEGAGENAQRTLECGRAEERAVDKLLVIIR
jgi:hypothetical protein